MTPPPPSPIFQAARYRIHPSSRRPLVQVLSTAVFVRRALMGLYRRIEEKRLYGGSPPLEAPCIASTVFSGKDRFGAPLVGHDHAFFLPADEDGDGWLDHVSIVARMAFNSAEQRALSLLRTVRNGQSAPPMLLDLVAYGEAGEMSGRLFRASSEWVSATPFISTRHLKTRGQKRDPLEWRNNPTAFLCGVMAEELARLPQTRPDLAGCDIQFDLLDGIPVDSGLLSPFEFQRRRPGKVSERVGARQAGAFRLRFSARSTGPICLGGTSHFGMGLFFPAGNC